MVNLTLTLFRFHYVRKTKHTHWEHEFEKKCVVVDRLALKYRHIFKNGQQKKVRPNDCENGQKAKDQLKNLTAIQPEIRPSF